TLRSRSTNTTRGEPRDNASSPIVPVRANRSSTGASAQSPRSRLNTASLTRSGMGRGAAPCGGPSSDRLWRLPGMDRVRSPPARPPDPRPARPQRHAAALAGPRAAARARTPPRLPEPLRPQPQAALHEQPPVARELQLRRHAGDRLDQLGEQPGTGALQDLRV